MNAKVKECVYTNGYLFFYSEIQNFTVALKRPFIFYRKMQNFKTVRKRPFRFLQQNAKFCKLLPNDHSFFYEEIQTSESCNQAAICISYKEIRNLIINYQFIFVSKNVKKALFTKRVLKI